MYILIYIIHRSIGFIDTRAPVSRRRRKNLRRESWATSKQYYIDAHKEKSGEGESTIFVLEDLIYTSSRLVACVFTVLCDFTHVWYCNCMAQACLKWWRCTCVLCLLLEPCSRRRLMSARRQRAMPHSKHSMTTTLASLAIASRPTSQKFVAVRSIFLLSLMNCKDAGNNQVHFVKYFQSHWCVYMDVAVLWSV